MAKYCWSVERERVCVRGGGGGGSDNDQCQSLLTNKIRVA